jgi:hypothetical protein
MMADAAGVLSLQAAQARRDWATLRAVNPGAFRSSQDDYGKTKYIFGFVVGPKNTQSAREYSLELASRG